MKLLICVSHLKNIESFLHKFEVKLLANASLSYLYSAKILHHEVDFLETGAGIYQTSYKLAKVLDLQKYHLAIKISYCNSYKEDMAIRAVLNIVNEKPGDFGSMVGTDWKDLYDLNLISREDAPHIRGGYINLANAYMNVFAPFKKVVGVTVNAYGEKKTFNSRKEKYKADCETTDGLGFAYNCLYEKQSFYHLAVVERNFVTEEENFDLATIKLNEILIDILQKI